MKRLSIMVVLIILSILLPYQSAVFAEDASLEKREKTVELPKGKLDRIKQNHIIKEAPKNAFKKEVEDKMGSSEFSSYVDMDGVHWEIEPNDTWNLADQIDLWALIRGSIDDYSNDDVFDDDYYRMEVTTGGTIGLVGIFEDEYYNDGLVFDLYDEYGNIVASSYPFYSEDGSTFQYLEADVSPGVHFVNVWSTYSIDNYMDLEYAFEINMLEQDTPELNEPITRLSGGGRYETAVAISKNGWNKSEYAVIATGLNFPDALSATPLAQKYNAPLLLSDKYKLSSSVERELIRLGVKKVFLVGGPGVLSTVLENNIKKLGIEPIRITGNHRYETAVNIAKHIGHQGEIVVATGENFADALSMAPIAAQLEIPIVLVQKNTVPNIVTSYIKDKTFNKTYVIGGTSVVSSDVAKAFSSAERISGSNRYQTNSRIIDKFKGSIDFTKLYIATGTNYPDALAGSALAAKDSAALLLTDYYPSSYTKSVINTHYLSILEYIVLGGEAVVPAGTLYDLFY